MLWAEESLVMPRVGELPRDQSESSRAARPSSATGPVTSVAAAFTSSGACPIAALIPSAPAHCRSSRSLRPSPTATSKATAMERVRHALDIPKARLVAVGDGRNDLELLQWAGAEGRSAAMGQAPDEVKAAATEVTGPVAEDGLAALLDSL